MKKFLIIIGLAIWAQMSFAQDARKQAEELNAAGAANAQVVDEESKKMYLKQSYDKESYYDNLAGMFENWMKCDIYDATPDAKGKVKPKHRTANSARLLPERRNLVNGGIYYFSESENFAKAQKCFSVYVDCASSALFAESNLAESDTLLPIIGHYATIASLKNKDYDAAIKYSEWGIKSSEGKASMEFKAEAYKEKGDTENYIKTLKEGLQKFPQNNFFLSNLCDYYVNNNKVDEALQMVDEMVKDDPSNYYSWFIKGYLLWEAKRFDEAIDALKKSISIKDDFYEAQVCVGDCYQMKAQAYGKDTPLDKFDAKVNSQFYADALPYYEKAYQLNPNDRNLIIYLHRCYYNTGNKEKADEFEAKLK